MTKVRIGLYGALAIGLAAALTVPAVPRGDDPRGDDRSPVGVSAFKESGPLAAGEDAYRVVRLWSDGTTDSTLVFQNGEGPPDDVDGPFLLLQEACGEADVNRDGIVDEHDLQIVILEWGCSVE